MVVSFNYSINDIFSLYPEYGCFFNDLNLILPSFNVFILKKWYHNEKQPSKADLKANVIYLRKKQMKNKDIGAWLIHEIAHLYFNTNRGAFFNKPYPMNIEEEFAFSCQFLFLKQKGNDFKQIEPIIQNAYESGDYTKYKPIFIDYWNTTSQNKIKNLLCI